MSISSRRSRLGIALAVLALLVAAALASSGAASSPTGLQHAILVQEQRSAGLLSRAAIVGTGVGRDESGAAEIVVLAKRSVGLPQTLDGIPVDVEVTGPLSSLKLAAPRARPGGGGKKETAPSPTSVFPRPVPIGVSTGNVEECSAGTIGARVKAADGSYYALSNNHVYAGEGSAPLGSKVLQPGRYDTGCAWSEENVIGSLAAFAPIVFSTAASNELDAAIASIPTEPVLTVGNSTPSNGYGTPSSTTLPALESLRLSVQKYGRTTSLTSGTVTAVNGIVNVGYSAGTARFVNQIIVQSNKPFIKAGDSGSLLVTKSSSAANNPVGLLFAGDTSGKYAVANPIDAVLAEFGVTVDGK